MIESESKCRRASLSAYLALRIDLAHRPQDRARLNENRRLVSVQLHQLCEDFHTGRNSEDCPARAAMFAQILQHIECRLEKVHVRSTPVARSD
jgi:hypothetical protein